jgi:hypothetical protein
MAVYAPTAPCSSTKTLLASGRVYRLERRPSKSLMRRLRGIWRARQG